MKRIITFFIIFTIFMGNVNTVYGENINNNEETIDNISESTWSDSFPNINSDAAIVIDAETGSVLYDKNIHKVLYPASITKILTTLVALENSSMNEIVTFSHEAIFDVDLNSSRIGIDVNEQLTMEQCLYAIMLASANEVCYAVAEHIAGDVPSFTKLMNEKAKELGAINSNFTNPHGLPDPDHYTTAYDMAMIAKGAIENEEFQNLTQTRTYSIPPTNIQEETRYLANHHKFIKNDIPFDGVIGGKTGFTSLAKYTLVTYAKRDDMTLISVIMHCPSVKDEYDDTSNLLNHAFDNFDIYNIDEVDTLVDDIDFFSKYHSFFNSSNTPLEVSQNGKIILPKNMTISDTEKNIELIPLTELVEGKNKIGQITYSYNNQPIGKSDIIFNNINSLSLLQSLYVDAPAVTEENTNKPAESKESKDSKKPIIIGVTVGAIVFILGLILIFSPFKKASKRRRYRSRKSRRFK